MTFELVLTVALTDDLVSPSPKIQEGRFGVNVQPSEGNNFLGFICVECASMCFSVCIIIIHPVNMDTRLRMRLCLSFTCHGTSFPQKSAIEVGSCRMIRRNGKGR